MNTDVIRFGLRASPTLLSSTWKVWAGSDSTVYLANRPIGHALKVSLHPPDPERPGHEWRVALTSEHWESVQGAGESRVLDSWDSEKVRLGDTPLKQGIAVVMGRFSLGYHPTPNDPDDAAKVTKSLRSIDWVDPPPEGEAWQVTIFVGDPHTRGTPPGTRAMGSIPMGRLELPNDGEVWVVRHLIPMATADVGAKMEQGLSQIAPDGLDDGVHRLLLRGNEDGLRFWIETAVTKGAPMGALDFD